MRKCRIGRKARAKALRRIMEKGMMYFLIPGSKYYTMILSGNYE